MLAAKEGASAIMVERHRTVGGGCTHWGTIPSKTLRHTINELLKYRHNPLLSELGARELHQVSFPKLMRAVDAVVAKQVSLRRDFYQRNQVPVVHGQAAFADAHTLDVDT